MSWQNFLILAVFVAVCGFIAYIGDLLGRRMGKKRLSLFGLRPRYTAIVTTSITGMLIAVLTITILTLASSEMRQMVLRGAQVLEDLNKARADYTRVSKELDKQKKLISQVQQQAIDAVGQKDKLAAEVARIDGKLKTLRGDLAGNKAALRRAELSLGKAGTNLVAANKEIATRRELIKNQQTAIAKHEARLDVLSGKNQALRERRVIFRPGQEIARKTIYGSQTKPIIRRQVLSLLDEAEQKARDNGAAIGENGKAIEIISVKVNDTFLKEDESISLVVDQIAADGGSVVLRIVSVGNELEGEATLINFSLVFNKLIYPAGAVVGSILVDPQSSLDIISNSLMHFLRTEVRTNAINKGLIPIYDDAGEPTVGGIGMGEIVDLVNKVKASGKTVEVRAIAEKDTWAADSLKLRFEIGDPK